MWVYASQSMVLPSACTLVEAARKVWIVEAWEPVRHSPKYLVEKGQNSPDGDGRERNWGRITLPNNLVGRCIKRAATTVQV